MAAILVIFQAFPPDPAAGGQCVADVCATLARQGAKVRVIAADRGYDDPTRRFPAREQLGGVEVRRVGFASFGKSSLFIRLVGGLFFVANATVRGLTGPRPDAVLVSNSPPMAALAGLIIARRHRVPLIHWLMDLNPDAAVAIGMVRPTAIMTRLLDWLNRQILRKAHTVIVMDQPMAQRFAAKGAARARVLVIPPWGGPQESAPDRSPEDNTFRRAHQLQNRFVVMYSGNHNLVHPLSTLLDAAERLQDDSRFIFVFVGGGLGKIEVEARRLPNVLSLPYQPRETLADSLSAGDLHVVTMGDTMLGIVHPSKIYGILAVGKPVLYIGPPQSHVAEIVERHQLGWSVRHGDLDRAIDALRAAVAQSVLERAGTGARARAALEREYQPSKLRQQVAQVLLGAASPQ